MVDWKDEEIPCMASDFPSDSEHDHWRFFTRPFDIWRHIILYIIEHLWQGETFNFFHRLDYYSNNFDSDLYERFDHLVSTSSSYIFCYLCSSHVVYQLQTVYNRQRKS